MEILMGMAMPKDRKSFLAEKDKMRQEHKDMHYQMKCLKKPGYENLMKLRGQMEREVKNGV